MPLPLREGHPVIHTPHDTAQPRARRVRPQHQAGPGAASGGCGRCNSQMRASHSAGASAATDGCERSNRRMRGPHPAGAVEAHAECGRSSRRVRAPRSVSMTDLSRSQESSLGVVCMELRVVDDGLRANRAADRTEGRLRGLVAVSVGGTVRRVRFFGRVRAGHSRSAGRPTRDRHLGVGGRELRIKG